MHIVLLQKSVSAPTTSEFDETIITVNGKRYSLLSKLGAGGSSKVGYHLPIICRQQAFFRSHF